MPATFDTASYKRAHGKAPRGTGCWAFAPNNRDEWDSEWVFSPTLTYTAAKAWAQNHNDHATRFEVGP